MPDLRQFTLWARELLTKETAEQLQQVYRLDAETGARLQVPKGHLLEQCAGTKQTRARIEKLLDDETDAGLSRAEGIQKLIRETAFTHLNRFVAFKLMEARGLIASPIARGHNANGFIKWAVSRPDQQELYERGDMPKDAFGEGPRDRAYRNFLLWQSAELSREIRVLFDPDNLPSQLFPRPGVLKELVDALNSEERKEDWLPGNEETIGWVYQYFIANEKSAAFDRVFNKKGKFQKSDIPAATQIFTPRWIVRFLVENSLGRLWLSMHPDSQLGQQLTYLVEFPADAATSMKPLREIRLLDPATGTMHFGLVAFELLARMYQEEMANAGQPGWPDIPSVAHQNEIPGAILANNLFGIDIDFRAVQLAALVLYLKAKALNKSAAITESNLACADVAIFRGEHLTKVSKELELPAGVTRALFEQFRDSLEEASMMGSLVRLENHFGNLQTDQLRRAIDNYTENKRAAGVDESYFAHEASKGIRLLNVLERRYDIVFTNPPYVSNRNMNSTMSEFMKRNYKRSKGDLYSAFIERGAELLGPEGRLAMITQQSFMFISSFAGLREMLLGTVAIESVAHVGPKAFAEVTGEKVNTTAFVLRREQMEMHRRDSIGVYFRLTKEPDAEAKRLAFERALACRRRGDSSSRLYEYRQGDFTAISGNPWLYWMRPGIRRLFSTLPSLDSTAKPKHGLSTCHNFRYLRQWWEIGLSPINRACLTIQQAAATDSRWFPYMKGGSFQRWFGNQTYVVNWLKDGEEIKADILQRFPYLNGNWGMVVTNPEYYFRRGVTWTDLTAGKFSARLSPGGFIFDVKGSSAFPDDIPLVLGLLNSSFANYALNLINPTVSYQVGDLARLPVPNHSSGPLRNLVDRAVVLARAETEEDETTYEFVSPPAWPNGIAVVANRRRDLTTLELEINEEVYRLYEISPEDRHAIEEERLAPSVEDESEDDETVETGEDAPEPKQTSSLTEEELAHRWINYAIGVALGRFEPGEPNGLGRGTFSPKVNEKLRKLVTANGMMILQRDHPNDLAARVSTLLTVIYGDAEAGNIIGKAIGSNGELRDTLAAYLQGSYFKAHVKQYRKRPIYWLLQSPKQRYSVYLFHEKATDQTLASLQGTAYLGGRIFQLNKQIEDARRREGTAQGRDKVVWRNTAQELSEELADFEAFDQAIASTNNESTIDAAGRPATACWSPEFDDGVLLNAAPLYRLTPAWKKADAKLDLKKVWEALKAGEYPWAKTAMRYWPRETLTACKDNESYRIAHGLE